MLVAGCSQQRANLLAADLPSGGTFSLSIEGLANAPSAEQWSALDSRSALMRLPDRRGQVVSMRERRSPQWRAQEIEWTMPGGARHNLLTIAVHGGAARPDLYPAKPSEAGIKAEIAEGFPSQRFTIMPEPRRNAYGPYGLAVLTGADGMRCVYAWQWLDADDRRVREALGGSASWRARICRKLQTLDEIAAVLDAITIGQGSSETGASKAAAVPVNAVRRQPAKTAVDRLHPIGRQPAPASIGRGEGGQRYLAAVTVIQLLPAGGGSLRTVLDQTLPAEAYRGPGSRQIPQPGAPVRKAAMARHAVPKPD